jgi:hypothetical protein
MMKSAHQLPENFWEKPRTITALSDYFPTRNIQKYLDFCRSKTTLSDMVIANTCGYKTLDNFGIHREDWHKATRRIPLAYLESIGCDLDKLMLAARIDMRNYKVVNEYPRKPKEFFFAGHMVHGRKGIPEYATEADVILLMWQYHRNGTGIPYIKYGNAKKIYVYGNGVLSVTNYYPELVFTKSYLLINTEHVVC